MGSEQDTGSRVAEYAAMGVETTDEQIAEARAEARRKLADKREHGAAAWERIDQLIADTAA